MRFSVCAVCLAIAVQLLSAADQVAITEEGLQVLLKDDGTWTYVDSSEKARSRYDFRRARWGMTISQVRATEKGDPTYESKPDDTPFLLMYDDTIQDRSVSAGFIFRKGVLIRSAYLLNETYTNRNDYLVSYAAFKRALMEKYGTPTDDEVMWRNDLFRNDSDEWGLAVSIGHLTLYASWKTDNTDITLELSGNNYNVTLRINYVSRQLAGIEKKAQEDEMHNKL